MGRKEAEEERAPENIDAYIVGNGIDLETHVRALMILVENIW